MLTQNNSLSKAKIYLIYASCLILFAFLLDYFYTSSLYHQLLHRRFQERFIQAENELQIQLDEISILLSRTSPYYIFSNKQKDLRRLANKEKIYFFIYQSDSTILWSDNRIPEIDILPLITDFQQFVQLSNGWFYAISRIVKNYKVIGLLLIKDNYIINNQFLTNEFNPIFQIPSSVGVRSGTFKEKYPINNIHGVGIFSLDFSNPLSYKGIDLLMVPIVLILSLIFIVLTIQKIIAGQLDVGRKIKTIISFSLLLSGIYILMRNYNYPLMLMKTFFFNEKIFSYKATDIVLADFFALTLIIYLIVLFLYSWHKEILVSKKTGYFVFLWIIITVLFTIINLLFEQIGENANISYNISNIFSHGITPFFLFISFAMLFSSFIFLLDICVTHGLNDKKIQFIILILLLNFVMNRFLLKEYLISFLIFTISLLFVLQIRKVKKIDFKFHHVFFLMGIFSLYSVFITYKIGNKKILEEEKKLAQELSMERDKIAENLLADLSLKIYSDTTLYKEIFKKDIDYPWILKYVKKRYFTGYLDRYDMQLTICKPEDSVLIKPNYQFSHCYAFFDSIIKNYTEKISTNFYFLKNYYGRIGYFGLFPYKREKQPINLYIQLESRFNTDVFGYPQLLLNEYDRDDRLKEYSYAKYYKNRIAYQSGSFIYNASTEKYPQFNDAFHREKFGGYEHLFYRPNNDVLIILSRPNTSIFDIIVSFSYLFIINLILFNFMYLLINRKIFNISILKKGFRMRIQLTIIGILIFSLIFVAFITVYFITQQYSKKYFEAFGEKLQSIYMELYSNFSNESKITYIWHSNEYSNLESYLQHLSNLFSTDIHLYSKDGYLIASSRSEIFEKGLCSNRMNPIAFFQLIGNRKMEYIQNEWIGKQKYFSIYTPLVNRQGNVLAYINLPYFTQQSKLSEEISTFLLAIINIYIIFIIIAVSIALYTANKLTRPLQIVQETIAQMKLGKGNVKIQYAGQDELGNLIAEYNKKVEELEHSVEVFSKVQRESAWREMARQVAHEIRNPLTPIKLSIQQLQRMVNNEKKIDEAYFHKVTQAIIEQIDNLSNIASAFSNLAQMPVPNKEQINLNQIIEEVVTLYQDAGVNFYLKFENNDCWIMADKEQMRRVFINLITNSIQAFSEETKGNITISLKKEKQKCIIIVEDDGTGVSPEVQEKLFQPNFTTKSSGSGLGLAICKSIIEYIGGNIKYEPRLPNGSKFIISLPLFERNS